MAKAESQHDVIKGGGVGALPPLHLVTTVDRDTTELQGQLSRDMSRHPVMVQTEHMEIEFVKPCGGTHIFDPDAARYLDGTLASTCTHCDEMLYIKWLPGGTGATMLRFVAESILESVDLGMDIPPNLLEQLLEAHQRVLSDKELVDDSLALYQTLRRVIENHAAGG